MASIKQYTDVPELQAEGLDGVTIRWVIGKDDGAPHFAMRVLEVQAGRATLHHSHWWEHEVYVLDGQGVVVLDEGETAIAAGSVVLVDGGEMHQFRNTGEGVLRFICLIPHMSLAGWAESKG